MFGLDCLLDYNGMSENVKSYAILIEGAFNLLVKPNDFIEFCVRGNNIVVDGVEVTGEEHVIGRLGYYDCCYFVEDSTGGVRLIIIKDFDCFNYDFREWGLPTVEVDLDSVCFMRFSLT